MRETLRLPAAVPALALLFALLLTPAALAQNPSCLDAGDGSPTCAVEVDDDGNVGVGTSSPEAALDVRGDFYCEGGTGDVNESGGISILDVAEVIDHLNGTDPFDEDEYARADVNCDGRVDYSDVGLVVELFKGVSKAVAVRSIESVYGAISPDVFYVNGEIGVGVTNPSATVHIDGDLRVDGSILQNTTVLHADYVFEPDYELESIEDHSSFMWEEKHLPAIPARSVDEAGRESVDVGAHRRGLVEELEKAHIYIAQLHERLERLEAALARSEGGGSR